MTSYDDDLAALHALDALEPDEQADAELRLGTFPAQLSDAAAALAELAATTPPTDLRADVLATARARRAPGRPVDGIEGCTPHEAFVRTISDLHGLLESLNDAEWAATAHPEHGSVHDLIAHLIGLERLSCRWLDPDDSVPEMLDHVSSTLDVVAELSSARPDELIAQWQTAASAVADAAAAGDRERRITFHDITTSVDGFLSMRTFELWAHAMDIASATGRPIPELDPERMTTMSARLMAAVPMALAYRRSTALDRTASFVLTGSSGGSYTVALDPRSEVGEPDVTIVVDTIDLCRVAARRLLPRDLSATIIGDRDLADLVLAGLDAFARD